MKFYKNTEIASEYSVSLPTVANWIKDSITGKKNLELIDMGGKHYIAKTDTNIKLIRTYVVQGFKYKPSNVRIIAEPDPNFIKHLSGKQLIEIKKGILDKKLLDIKFAYVGGGATLWDNMYNKSGGSSSTYEPYNKMNILIIPRILELLREKQINIVEIGAGNGKPLLDFLHALNRENKLNSYISIDISSEMNEIQRHNLSSEFPTLKLSSYVIDVENESFEDIVYEIHQEYPESINVFILYGGTFGNFANPEKTIMNIEKSMITDDVLCINNPYPHPDRFKYAKYMYESPTADHYLFASRSLGLQVNPEDLEFYFDQKTTTRNLFLKIPTDHTLKFYINEHKETLDIPKGTKIQIWKNRMTDLDYIQSVTKSYDLQLVLFTLSSDYKFILTVYRKQARG
jgi:SAM-dependent methyltransferase